MRSGPNSRIGLVGRPEERDELAAALSALGRPPLSFFISAGPDNRPPLPAGGLPEADVLVVAAGLESTPEWAGPIEQARHMGTRVVDFPSYYEKIARRTPVDLVSDAWILDSPGLRRLRSTRVRAAKRILDVAGSLAALVLTLPLSLLIAALVKLTSPGPVFFIQERVGRGRASYRMWKFRTMVEGAEAEGPQWAEENDLRATRLGRLLRRTRLDELPQFLNVLAGTMSIVGPRPERDHFVRRLDREIPRFGLRFEAKPGITGWAQVHFPYTASVEDTREKLKYDLYYMRRFGLGLDLRIILRTVRVMLFGSGR